MVAVTLGSLFGAFSQWIVGLPEWQQGVVGALIVAGLLGFFPLVQWLYGAAKRKRELARERRETAALALRQAEDARRLAFESTPAELGTFDHIQNFQRGIDRIVPINKRVIEIIQHVEGVIKRTEFPQPSSPDFLSEKGRIIGQTAYGLHDPVTELEDLASEYNESTDLFVNSFRGLFKVPIKTDKDRKTLSELNDTYGPKGPWPGLFKQAALAVSNRGAALRGLRGHHQDMTRIEKRYSKALEEIQVANDRIHKYCSVELAKTVRTKLQE